MESFRVHYPLPEGRQACSSLLYVSTASPSLTLSDLDTLVTQSRTLNEKHGMTGVLLYGGGNFMQYVEGPKTAIDELQRRLARDSRHYDIHKILHEQTDRPRFSGWTMGFLSGEPRSLRAAFPALADDAHLAARLLEMGTVLERIMKNFFECAR